MEEVRVLAEEEGKATAVEFGVEFGIDEAIEQELEGVQVALGGEFPGGEGEQGVPSCG
jgi:hypothetical protein